MDGVKILLFSNDEKLYSITERIIGKKHQLKWCTYQQLENNKYPMADIVIFHFTKEIIEREGAFAAIIKIKGSLGHLTPILAISEGGSIQDIFSMIDVIVVSGLSRLSYCPEEILQTMELLQSFQVQIDCIGYGILDYARLKQYLMRTWAKQEQFEQDLDAYLCSCCTRERI